MKVCDLFEAMDVSHASMRAESRPSHKEVLKSQREGVKQGNTTCDSCTRSTSTCDHALETRVYVRISEHKNSKNHNT